MVDATHTSCPTRLEAVRQLSDHLKSSCATIPVMVLIDLDLALVEAATNIVQHGYAGRDDGIIHLSVRQSPDRVELELVDDGAPMQDGLLSACRPFSLDAESGRGIGIIQSCIDAIDYRSEQGVNRLRLIKYLSVSAE